MTHADAFLQDIIAHPADDTPRLVFADWLDDNGQPERAEFIRIQCQQSSLIASGYLCSYDPHCKVCVLRRRQEKLLTHDNFNRWIVQLPIKIVQNFRRGFVSAVTLPWESWRTHGTTLVHAAPLEHVTLSDATGYSAQVHQSGKPSWLFHGVTPNGIFWPKDFDAPMHQLFETQQAAIDALSDCCLTWAKKQP
jgi:uncharacterized protein (TIGR02996 family)